MRRRRATVSSRSLTSSQCRPPGSGVPSGGDHGRIEGVEVEGDVDVVRELLGDRLGAGSAELARAVEAQALLADVVVLLALGAAQADLRHRAPPPRCGAACRRGCTASRGTRRACRRWRRRRGRRGPGCASRARARRRRRRCARRRASRRTSRRRSARRRSPRCGLPSPRGCRCATATSGSVWMPRRYGSQPMPMSYSSMLPEASMIAAGPSREPTQPDAVESYGRAGRRRASARSRCARAGARRSCGGRSGRQSYESSLSHHLRGSDLNHTWGSGS